MDETRAQLSRSAELTRLRRELLKRIVANELRRQHGRRAVEDVRVASVPWTSASAGHAQVVCAN